MRDDLTKFMQGPQASQLTSLAIDSIGWPVGFFNQCSALKSLVIRGQYNHHVVVDDRDTHVEPLKIQSLEIDSSAIYSCLVMFGASFQTLHKLVIYIQDRREVPDCEEFLEASAHSLEDLRIEIAGGSGDGASIKSGFFAFVH
jgi:hypothetical protein